MEAYLVTDKSNIRYLSNFTGSAGFLMLIGKHKYLFTDSRYILRAKNVIDKNIILEDITRVWRNPDELKKHWQKILDKHKVSEIFIDENDLSVTRYRHFKKITNSGRKNKIKFKKSKNEIQKQREIKNEKEIKLIKKSQKINEIAFYEAISLIKHHLKNPHKPLTEAEVAWKIKESGMRNGAEDVSFEPIVAFGKNSASPHHSPGKTKLIKGEIILIDMGMKYEGYCSDMTRTFFTEKPKGQELEIYNIVLNAQENALKKLKAEMTGAQADTLSRSIIEKAGYGEKYTHSGGHGIGLDIHESPALSEKYSKKIHENTILTVEPGIYLEGKFGVRIEDMALIKKDKIENITKVSKSQDILLGL